MAPRVQVSDLARTGTRPVASPVDTYAPPRLTEIPRPAPDTSLADFVQALSSMRPSLERFIERRQEEYSEEEIKKGMAARAQNQQAWKQAVEAGVVPRAASPWFEKGYQIQDGRLTGEAEYYPALHAALAESGLAESDDPVAVQKYVGDFRAKFIAEKAGDRPNLDWMDGFVPTMRSAETAVINNFVQERLARREQKMYENTGREVSSLITDEIHRQEQYTTDEERNAGIERVAQTISRRLQELVAHGGNGTKLNRIAADAIIELGKQVRDPSLARTILSKISTKSGNLAGIKDVKEKLFDSELWIREYDRNELRFQWALEDRQYALEQREWTAEQREWARQNHEWTLKERAKAEEEGNRKAQAEALMGQIVSEIVMNPAKPIDRGTLQKLAEVDPLHVATMNNIQQNFLDSRERVIENKDLVNSLMRDMMMNPQTFDMRRIHSALASRQIDTSRMIQLVDHLRVLRTEETSDPTLGSQEFRELKARLYRDVAVDRVGQITGSGEINATDAVLELTDAAREWREKNPQGSPAAFRNHIREVRQKLLEKYNKLGLDQAREGRETESTGASSRSQVSPSNPTQQPQRKPTQAVDESRLNAARRILKRAQAANDQAAIKAIYRDFPQLLEEE